MPQQERLAYLRELLYGPRDGRSWSEVLRQFPLPSQDNERLQACWLRILALFEQWEPCAEREAALRYAQHHLEAWPDRKRHMDVLSPEHPGWSLVRSCALNDLSFGRAFGVRGRDPIDSLSQIGHISIRYLRDPTRLYQLRLLPKLHSLTLFDMFSMSDLEELRSLPQLTSFAFYVRMGRRYHNGIVDDIGAVMELPHLQDVTLMGLSDRCDITPLFSCRSLRKLQLSPMRHMTDLSWVDGWSGLEELHLQECHGLRSLEGIESASSLRRLTLTWPAMVEDVDALASLPALSSLLLDGCGSLHSLHGLHDHPGLESLGLSHNGYLTGLNGLRGLPSLRMLSLFQLSELRSLAPLESLPELEQVRLTNCRVLSSLDALQGCAKLEKVAMKDCPDCSLDSLSGEARLTELTWIPRSCPTATVLPSGDAVVETARWDWMERADAMSHHPSLHSLRQLSVHTQKPMASLGGVRLLRDLETLRLVGAPVRSLSGLEDAHLLQELEVESYAGDELFSLKDLPRLHRLSMDHAPDLLSLRGLSGCVALEELVLRDVVSLHDLRTVEHLPQLDRLVLSGLVWHDLIGPQLAKARFLSQLSLMRFERLRHLDWVEALEGLSELSLESLLQLEDLSGIANLPKLNALSIHSCPSVYPAPDKPSMHDREDVKAYQMQIATFSKKRGTLAGQLEKRVARWWPFG